MKGFIEVTNPILDTKILININSITDLCVSPSDDLVYIGFITSENDIYPVKETYEEIKELIKNAQ